MRRRDFIQLGVGAVLGLGFSDILRLRASAAAGHTGSKAGKQVNCILIWMDGGPSHYETFDPKPDAPSEIRGEFKAISTKVPGIQFSEARSEARRSRRQIHHRPLHLPQRPESRRRQSLHDDRHAHARPRRVRRVRHVSSVLTARWSPTIAACEDGMPAYMSMPAVSRSGGPNFLGGTTCAVRHRRLSEQSQFQSSRRRSARRKSAEGRAETRQELRRSLDRMKRFTDKLAEDPAVTFDQYYAQGLDLVASPKAQPAFDIHKEDEKLRERYGRNDFGQRLLLARRLVEVGVSFVTVYNGGWDHHTKIFEAYKGNHCKNLRSGRRRPDQRSR